MYFDGFTTNTKNQFEKELLVNRLNLIVLFDTRTVQSDFKSLFIHIKE